MRVCARNYNVRVKLGTGVQATEMMHERMWNETEGNDSLTCACLHVYETCACQHVNGIGVEFIKFKFGPYCRGGIKSASIHFRHNFEAVLLRG